MDTKDLILKEYKRHPYILVQDFFKLLYQNEFGPRHILEEPIKAKKYLIDEWNSIDKDSNIPLFEDIGNNYARLNLRRAKADNLDLDIIWDLFFISADTKGSKSDYLLKINVLENMINSYELPFISDDYYFFFRKIIESDFSPISH